MVIITDRDIRLMSMCAVVQWLTTAQIRRYLFPAAGERRVAARLRELRSAKFIHSVFGRIGASPSLFHTLGPAGRSVLVSNGWRGPLQLRSSLPSRLNHLMGINDIRLSVAMCGCNVNHFFAYWQLNPELWPHSVIPDAVFSVDAPHTINFLAEFDCGTEPRSVLDKKIAAYVSLRSSFFFNALIFVCCSDRMTERLANHFRSSVCIPVLAGTLSGIVSEGILSHRFIDVAASKLVTLVDFARPRVA